MIDSIVPEPLGGAYRDPHTAAHNLEQYIAKTLRDLKRIKPENLLERRYEKFRSSARSSRPAGNAPPVPRGNHLSRHIHRARYAARGWTVAMDDAIATEFSRLRLHGAEIPSDIRILLGHNEDLFRHTGIRLNWDEDWSPWLDTGYSALKNSANPSIASNIRAISEVCNHIDFVAEHEDSEYYGFWRGLEPQPTAASPVVCLDNEGQFRLLLAEHSRMLCSSAYGYEEFDELKQWMASIGIQVTASTLGDLAEPAIELKPHDLHMQLYRKYRG